ncbi:MAG: hypothetical protein ACKVW3_13180 [Phycisphaerales bacterium]
MRSRRCVRGGDRTRGAPAGSGAGPVLAGDRVGTGVVSWFPVGQLQKGQEMKAALVLTENHKRIAMLALLSFLAMC